jgi:type IV secretion system protein VirB6
MLLITTEDKHKEKVHMTINLFSELGAVLESATTHFANQHSQALAMAIYPYVYGGIFLWLTVMGFQVLSGRLQAPFINIVERASGMLILSSIAFGGSLYQTEILTDFDNLQNALVSAVAGEQTTPYQAADIALQRGLELGWEFAKKTSFTAEGFFGWTLGSIIVYVGSVLISWSAAGSIMVAKASLALVLSLGQAAIACAIFPATRKIFDAFMASVLNKILTITFLTIVMSFTLSIFTGVAEGFGAGTTEPLSYSFSLLIAVFVCVALVKSASTLASELAGGVAMAVSNPITAAARLATQPIASAANYLGGKASRTSARTGQSEYASRASHLLRGNTALNPAYRQKAMENMKGGWGVASGGSAKSSRPSKTSTEKLKEMARRREEKSKS